MKPAGPPAVSYILLLCMLALAGAGCAGSLVQRPDESHPLAGKWIMEINSADVGYTRVTMTLRTDGKNFEGRSREGAAGDVLGWWDLTLGKMFTDYFEHGALLHLKNGRITSTEPLEVEAVLQSALGPMLLRGKVVGGRLTGTLSRKGEIRGDMRGAKERGDSQAFGHAFSDRLDDYPLVVDSALNLTAWRIYNRNLLQSDEWKSFSENLRELSGKAQDDIDLIFGFFHYGEDLPFSHYFLFRKGSDPAPWQNADNDSSSRIVLKNISPSVAYLRIPTFSGGTREIEDAFNRIIRDNLPNLIIDLRGNTGGNISAMKVASYLADTSYYGGVFVTNKWFERNSRPPLVEEYDRFQTISESNHELLMNGIHEREGLCLKIVPEPKRYAGKVFVLTDGNTASACEPLVYGIKQYRLGTVVGERTAGAMLSSEEFQIARNWYLTVPTAEYYAADGYRIDLVGVEPDVKVESAGALEYVIGELIR